MTAASTTRPLLPSASQRRQLRRRTVRHRPPPSAPSATTPNRSPVVPSGPQWSPVVPSTRLGAVSSHSCCVHFRGRTMVCLSFACELLTAILWPHTSPAAPHYAADESTPRRLVGRGGLETSERTSTKKTPLKAREGPGRPAGAALSVAPARFLSDGCRMQRARCCQPSGLRMPSAGLRGG